MPSSTPYAASAAATPIASAKRPKKRTSQAMSITSPVRCAALDGGVDTTDAKTEGENHGTSSASGRGDLSAGDEAGTSGGSATTPLGKRAEHGSPAGEAEGYGTDSPSPTKAHKGSKSATPRTPRTGTLWTDSRRQQQGGDEQDLKSRVSGEGSVEPLEVKGGAEQDQDQNRHRPKESSIFSPALNHSHEEARDQAPASTVGTSSLPAAAAVGKGGKHARPGDNDGGGGGCQDASAAAVSSSTPQLERTTSPTEEEGGVGDAAVTAATEHARSGESVDVERSEEGRDGGADQPPELVDIDAEEEEEEDDEEEFNPYCFIAHLPPYNTVKHHTPEAPALPEKRKTRHGKELTLVLDLDETLVHCTVDPIVNPDHRFEVHFNGEEFQVYVRKRPHLDQFLEAVSELFEVVVFTASQQVYAERLLNMIDPQKKFVKYRLYRDACMPLEGNYLKDLNVLGRDLSKVAIVDNSPYAYGFQIDNGIPIESWFDDTSDEELLHLLPLLKQLINESESAGGDVRPFIRNIFKTHELVDKARNGDREVLESKSYPSLTAAGNNQEQERKHEAGAGRAGAGAGAGAETKSAVEGDARGREDAGAGVEE